MVKTNIPQVRILFLPYISASRPKGRRQIAVARRYAVGIQLTTTASIWSSLLIEGRAMLIEDPIKVTRKVLSAATTKTVLLGVLLLMLGLLLYCFP